MTEWERSSKASEGGSADFWYPENRCSGFARPRGTGVRSMAMFKLFGGDETLYDRFDLAALQAQSEVERVQDRLPDIGNEEQLIEELYNRIAIQPLELMVADERISQHDVKVDVSNDFLRGGPVAPGTWMVDGFRLKVRIPFSGDPLLFRMRTSSFTTRRPHGDVESSSDDGGEIVFHVDVPADLPEDQLVNKLRQEKEDNVRLLTRWVGFVNQDVDGYNARLKQEISGALASRLELLRRRQRLRDALGIEASQRQSGAPRQEAQVRRVKLNVPAQSPNRPEEHRDFFISHASEDKDFVRQLVEALEALAATVWFDEYEIQVGDSLRAKIEHGLKISTYGVIVVSPRLMAKKDRGGWIKREIGGLMARQEDERPVILPVWYETSATSVADEFPTLADTAALDAGTMTADEIANALWERKLADER